MLQIQPLGVSRLTFCCLILLSYCSCSYQDKCLSPCENAIQLSVPEGGSLGSPHNISEKSLFMCKCSTSTASCEVVAVALNGKSQCLISSICPRVSMTSKYFNVTNASKNDTAVYKIIDALFHRGNGLVLNLTVHDRALLTPFTSQPPLAREGPRTTTEEGAGPPHRNYWIVSVSVVVLGAVLGAGLFIACYVRRRRPPPTPALLQMVLCLSANTTASQLDESHTASLELTERGTPSNNSSEL